MTMKAPKTVPAGEFKAKCLGLLEEVARTRASFVVTKRGRAVARVVPVDVEPSRSLRGSLVWSGDITAPLGDAWDVDR